MSYFHVVPIVNNVSNPPKQPHNDDFSLFFHTFIEIIIILYAYAIPFLVTNQSHFRHFCIL